MQSGEERHTDNEEDDWLEEKVAEVRKPEKKRRIPDYQTAVLPCDACQ